MAYSFQIDSDHGVVLFKGTGTFSVDEMTNGLAEVLADPAFKSEFNHLVDMRDVTEFEPRTPDIRGRAYRDRESVQFNSSRIAIVSANDLVFALSRMYATLMEDSKVSVRVFREMSEAREWLGLPIEEN